jgi:hypothetical protein
MRVAKKLLVTMAVLVLSVIVLTGPTIAQLLVQVSNVGSVQGQTKELTISAQTVAGAELFGVGVSLPPCAVALATSFSDVATASIDWGTALQGNTDYEIFFCLGNIGASAGTVHISTTGQATGETEVFEEANNGLTGLVFSPCDGASISGGGVIAVRGHLHTPSVGLNGVVSLSGKTAFTFS